MSYPKKVPAVLIDSEHIVLLEAAGFGVDIIGLGFRIDDNESSFGRYVKGTVFIIVHISDKEFSRTVQDGVKLPGFRI